MAFIMDSIMKELNSLLPKLFYVENHEEEEQTLLDTQKQNVQHFIDSLHSTYSDELPTFISASLNDALQQSFESNKAIILYFHNEFHEDTPQFINNILSDSSVIDYLNENFLLWGCNIQDSFSYKTLMSIPVDLSTFPCLYLVKKYDENKPIKVFGGIQGYDGLTPELFTDKLMNMLLCGIQKLDQLTSQTQIAEEERHLRDLQEEAYKQAIEEDNERQRKEQEELERKKKEEEEEERKKQKENEYEQYIESLKQNLPKPPLKGKNIRITLPNGEQFKTIIDMNSKFELLFDIITIYLYDHQINIKQYEIFTPLPKKTFSFNDKDKLLTDEYSSNNIAFFIRDLDA